MIQNNNKLNKKKQNKNIRINKDSIFIKNLKKKIIYFMNFGNDDLLINLFVYNINLKIIYKSFLVI